ncbi:MAG TPA: SDR family oxidoreductase, partial [Anaerolineales bacterium]|nr:SDR family oxidoreductase [Anaerolineales bacterium]
KTMYKAFEAVAPLHENVTTEDVANAALFLCSDMSARTTGEVLYVDSGYNIMGVPDSIDG